ncbi:hypothetical protein [Natrialba aegyptia]|uniref:hypothetical protein n=1 Tax=Natrialba aegyptia TaxID=129789 RepID=UPI001267BC3D|nr:hypothetical protein [Natrialba aegyptia]
MDQLVSVGIGAEFKDAFRWYPEIFERPPIFHPTVFTEPVTTDEQHFIFIDFVATLPASKAELVLLARWAVSRVLDESNVPGTTVSGSVELRPTIPECSPRFFEDLC